MSSGTGAAPGSRLTEYGVCGVLAGWLVSTALMQHPSPILNRLRRFDTTGAVLPNWRFFAPRPADYDYRLLHRLLHADGTQSEWSETVQIPPRRLIQMFWFPDRRLQKGMWDLLSTLARDAVNHEVSSSVAYRKIRDLVSVRAIADHEGPAPQGFQFLVVTHTGHDEEPEPIDLFASGLEPWRVHELAAT